MLKPSNQLLAALPPKELELIRPDLVDLDLPVGQVLFNPGDIFRDVYFPTTAVISMQIVMKDGKPVEVTTVGHEGLLGGVRLFYDDDEAFARAICDMSGHVQKIRLRCFGPESRHSLGCVMWSIIIPMRLLWKPLSLSRAVRLTHCPNALLGRC